jgi:hypothetical protein
VLFQVLCLAFTSSNRLWTRIGQTIQKRSATKPIFYRDENLIAFADQIYAPHVMRIQHSLLPNELFWPARRLDETMLIFHLNLIFASSG